MDVDQLPSHSKLETHMSPLSFRYYYTEPDRCYVLYWAEVVRSRTYSGSTGEQLRPRPLDNRMI